MSVACASQQATIETENRSKGSMAAQDGGAAVTQVQWNESAAEEALQVVHEMHDWWATFNFDSVRDVIAEEGFLATFELDPEYEPVRLAGRDELIAYIKSGFAAVKETGGQVHAKPFFAQQCKASDTVAYCTEECVFLVKNPDGTVEETPLQGTSVLVKTAEGWKFTHWHVSRAGPRMLVATDGTRTKIAAQDRGFVPDEPASLGDAHH